MKLYSYKSLISGSNRNTNYLCHDGIHSIVFFKLLPSCEYLLHKETPQGTTYHTASQCQ